MNLRRLIVFCLAATPTLSVCLLHAQESGDSKKTYFGNLFLDTEGHICYMEPLDDNPLNRFEYRSDGREIISIFKASGENRSRVEITDYNSDGKPDLIYLERDAGEHTVTKVNFFRGSDYVEHLKRHFGHALVTATHPLIKDDPAEKKRAAQIEVGLEALNNIELKKDDIGIYSAERLFKVTRHKDIQLAFVAADTLVKALKYIVEGDYRILSQEAQIAKTYGLEIGILLGFDPANYTAEKP